MGQTLQGLAWRLLRESKSPIQAADVLIGFISVPIL